jgi:hypothetical protein
MTRKQMIEFIEAIFTDHDMDLNDSEDLIIELVDKLDEEFGLVEEDD